MSDYISNVDEIFCAAIELSSPEERGEYVERACGGNAELRHRVDALLAAHFGAGDFLERSPATALLPDHENVQESPGTLIGPYKLLEQIGEGGMGVVYMADQQAPVRRRVALKVIKTGMDTRQVIARFEAERQALAMMDHVNIARVLDAGATDSGRPYFVMELVRGIPITEYCDQNNLAVHERLELFVQVCSAVQHAHQKGIIHRDLKPSNVLVSTQDDRPVAKVIDFGVAKAMQGQLTEKTLFTEFQHLVGTPAYMSPEQASGSLDVDTRSDVYSLGVLLYELLAGTPPFDPKELRSKTLAEMQRIIREVEPPTPSTRLKALDDTLATVAAQRSVEPRKLAAMVHGELDWIVMKALEKDRTRRYETPGGLARDIERYLRDEPVLACPPSLTYRLKKFVRRNKIAAAFVLLLAAAITALAVSNIQTRRNERRAITENAKAQAVSNLLQGMLASANPDQAKAAEYTVRQLLDDFAVNLGTELADQPEVEAEIRATVGRAYWRLGVADQAEPHLTRALELRRRQFGPDHEKVAESQVDYAWCRNEQRRQPEAEAAAREALRIYRVRGTAGLPVIQARAILQRVLINSERFDEAQAVAEEALALARASGVEYPEVATILHALADTHIARERYPEAEQAARQAVELHRRLHGPKHPETAWGLVALGNALKSQKKYPEAEAAFREALTIFRERYTGDHHSLDSTLAGLKIVLEGRGDLAGLEALTRENLEDATIVTDQAIVDGRLKRAQLHIERGQWDEASDDLEQASALTKKNDKPRREKIAAASRDAANRLQDHPVAGQDPDLREPLLRRALALHTGLANEFPDEPVHFEEVGHLHRRLGFLLPIRLDETRQHFEKAAEIFEKLAADNPQRGGYYRDYQAHSLKFLAQTLAAAGHAQEAIAAARRGVDVCQALTKEYPGNLQYRQWLASALSVLVERQVATGQTDEANATRQQALQLWESLLAEDAKDRQAREKLSWMLTEIANELQPDQKTDRDLLEKFLRRALALHVELAKEMPGDLRHFEERGHFSRRLGWLLRDMGHTDEARKCFEQAADAFEKLAADKIPQRDGFYRAYQVDSLWDLARLLATSDAKQAAAVAQRSVDICQTLTKEYPGNLQYQQRLTAAISFLVERLGAAGQNDEAEATRQRMVKIWDALLAEQPKDRQAREQLASTLGDAANGLQGQSDRDVRERLLRRALALREELDATIVSDQAIVDSRMKRASLHSQLREWKEAIDDLEKATSLTEEDDKPQRDKIAAAYVELCFAAFNQQKFDIVESAARKAIELQPSNGAAHFWLGIALSNLGNQEDAITAYHKAIELKPDDFGNYRSLSLAFWRVGKFDEAVAACRKAIELQPERSELYSRLGSILIDQGKVEEGLAAIDKAFKLNPRDTASMNQIAWFLATTREPQHRDPARAVELAKKAVDLAPQDGAIWNTLGVAQYRAGEWKLAVEALEKSMKLRNGGDASDWLFVAMAESHLDHKDEARKWYDQAVEWMDKNQSKNEELLRFRNEAAELLGISKPAKSTDAAPQP